MLFHGQAHTERELYVNKDMFFENLEETSLIGHRVVYDYINCTGIKMQDFTVANDLKLSCKGAHVKYVAALEEKREEKKSFNKNNKIKVLCEEIADVKTQKLNLESCIGTLKKDTDALFLECDSKTNAKEVLEIVAKSNAFRKSAIEKESMIVDLAKE